MAELFPQGSPAYMLSGYYDMKNVEERAAQEALRSQDMRNINLQKQMQIEEARKNLPLLELQRQVNLGTAGGELARQPDVLSREATLARGSAQRAPLDVDVADLQAAGKARI